MWTCFLLGKALASPLDTSVLVAGASSPTGDERVTWLGLQAGLEGNVSRFAIGGRALGGPTLGPAPRAPGFVVGLQPTARVWLFRRPRGGLSALVAGGIEVGERVAPLLSGGLAFDHSRSERVVRPRWEANVHGLPGTGTWRLGLSIGLVFRRRPTVLTPVQAPDNPLDTDGVAWVPLPVCDWRTVDELGRAPEAAVATLDQRGFRWLRDAAATDPPTAVASSAAAAAFPTSRPTEPEPESADQPLATVVVAAFQGDEIVIAGEPQPVDDQGVVAVDVPPGHVEIVVRGGGRERRFDVLVPESTVLWVAAEAPAPIRVPFALGRSVLDDAGKAAVAALAETLGDWSFEVRGSHSPDGAPIRNLELAKERARTVVSALTSAGVAPGRVQVVDKLDVEESDEAPDALRVAIVYPVEMAP